MDAKDFAERLVKRLRIRATDYRNMVARKKATVPISNYALPDEILSDKTMAQALDETADCIEETLASYDEE